MKHIRYSLSIITLFTLSFALLAPYTVQAVYDETSNGVDVAEYEPGSVIVQFKEGQSPVELQQKAAIEKTEPMSLIDKIKSALIPSLNGVQTPEQQLNSLSSIDAEVGVFVKKSLDYAPSTDQNIFVYTFDKSKSVNEVIAQYAARPEVESVEPNYIYHFLSTPNDTHFTKMWSLTKIKAPAAWDITTGSKSVLVADIDSGIDDTHPDLKNNIVEVKSFVSGCGGGDQVGHGTHTAGTIAAVGNNQAGTVGLNWQVELMALKVGCTGGMQTADIINAINYAVSKRAKVINMSLGGPCGGSGGPMSSSIANAVQKGAVVVVAAGNAGKADADTNCPASDPNAITVSATGPNDEFAHYSSYGNSVDVAAPGGNPPGGSGSCSASGSNCILSTVPGGRYAAWTGTSMAAPHVTGLVALMFAADPSLTPARIKQILESTAVDLGPPGRDTKFGSGRIDAEAALKAVSGGGPLPTAQPTAIPFPTTRPTTIPFPTTRPTSIPTYKPIPTIDNSNGSDFDHNGRVDLADYNQWRTAYLSGNSTLKYFNIWRIAYLKTTF